MCGCASKSFDKLVDYPSVTKIFTEQEVSDLQALLNLFEQEIGIQPDASSEAKAAGYAVFNKQVVAWYEKGDGRNFPLTNEQITKILDVLHVKTFRSLWSIGINTYPNGQRRPSFSIHTQGKLMDLISELGKEYPLFTDLTNELRMAGDLTPNFTVTLFLQNNKFNMRDARVRLVYLACCLRGEWKN